MNKKYQTLDALNQVAQFHTTFKAPIEPKPIIPTKDRSDLRVSLLQEELNELKDAIAANDIVEVADALCDLQYVLSGAVLEFGLGEKFPELFAEVQRSNMSKACRTQAEAEDTIDNYAEQGIVAGMDLNEETGLVVIYRASDNKTLKSINYSPANLKPILNK